MGVWGQSGGLCLAIQYLREGAIVPDVAMVGEAVVHKAQIALLDVLLDGIELLTSGDLQTRNMHIMTSPWRSTNTQHAHHDIIVAIYKHATCT